MERKINVTLEKKDYISLFFMLMNKRLLFIAAIPLIIAIPVGVALLAYMAGDARIPLSMLLLPYVCLIVILLLIFLRALIAPAVKQFKLAQKEFGNKFSFLLSSEGFVCTGGASEAQYSYKRLNKATETKKYIFFFVNEGQACIIPKREMSEGDLAFLRGLLPKCAILPASEVGEELNATLESEAARHHKPPGDLLDSSNDPLA